MIRHDHISCLLKMEASPSRDIERDADVEVAAIAQPDKISIPLFLHQLKSIENMVLLERTKEVELTSSIYINSQVGILADLPGYGKSLSMLGLIAHTLDDDMEQSHQRIQTTSFPFVSKVKVDILQQMKCSLVVVNVSLISQWIQELSRTLLRFLAVHRPGEVEGIDTTAYDVIIVGNNIYNLFSQVYKKKAWKRFIIDEPASLKIAAMESSNAPFYWLITGTPHEMYQKRRCGFLNDLLPPDDHSDMFEHLILKNEDHFVRSSYEMPATRHFYYTCVGNPAEWFEGIVSDAILEMIQAGNITGAFNLLEHNGVDQTLVEAYRTRKQKRLLELKRDADKAQEKIEEIESHLSSLESKMFRFVIQYPCIICGRPHRSTVILSCCQYLCCGECIADSAEMCPLCRSAEFIKVDAGIKGLEDVVMRSPLVTVPVVLRHKMSMLMEIVGDTTGKKILIFSNYNESFSIIKKFLDERSLLYLELRGKKEKRDTTIDAYKSGSVNILLLNTIHSGAGLNLQETTDIILYHKIHEYQKIQVIGRANRIGRTSSLTVHYLE